MGKQTNIVKFCYTWWVYLILFKNYILHNWTQLFKSFLLTYEHSKFPRFGILLLKIQIE